MAKRKNKTRTVAPQQPNAEAGVPSASILPLSMEIPRDNYAILPEFTVGVNHPSADESYKLSHVGMLFTCRTDFDHALAKTGFLSGIWFDGNRKIRADVPKEHVRHVIQQCIGKRSFERFICNYFAKEVTNPGSYFDVTNSASTIEVPSNFDTIADIGMEKILEICSILDIKVKVKNESINIPTELSKGTERGFISSLSYLLMIAKILQRGNDLNFHLPVYSKDAFCVFLRDLILFKYASKHDLQPYLKYDKKRGECSEISFLDKISSWGTPVAGNILARVSSFMYHIINRLIDHKVFGTLISPSLFTKGDEIKKQFEPVYTITEEHTDKKGKKHKDRKEITINIFRPDNMRWLYNKERQLIRGIVHERRITTFIEQFDAIPTEELNGAKYRELKSIIANEAQRASALYYKIRRFARARFFSIKAVWKNLKISDFIEDSKFNNDEFYNQIQDLTEEQIMTLNPEQRAALRSELSIEDLIDGKNNSSKDLSL